MESVFPSPTDPQITAPLFLVESEREMFANVHDVRVTSLDSLKTITGLDRVSRCEGVRVTDVRVSIPDEAEKREYPIGDSDGLNVMEEIVRVAPEQMKRESVKESEGLNGFVTVPSPSG